MLQGDSNDNWKNIEYYDNRCYFVFVFFSSPLHVFLILHLQIAVIMSFIFHIFICDHSFCKISFISLKVLLPFLGKSDIY